MEPIIGYKTFIISCFILFLIIGYVAELIVKHQENKEKEKSPSDAVTSNEPIKKLVS